MLVPFKDIVASLGSWEPACLDTVEEVALVTKKDPGESHCFLLGHPSLRAGLYHLNHREGSSPDALTYGP